MSAADIWTTKCIVPGLLLHQAETLCKAVDGDGPTREDYLSFLIILEAAVLADELAIFDVRSTAGHSILEGNLARALGKILPIRVYQWEPEENLLAEAFALDDNRPTPYSAFFEQKDGDFVIAGSAIWPGWAVEKYCAEVSDDLARALAVTFAQSGFDEIFKILKPSECERFKRQHLARILWELDIQATVSDHFDACAKALPSLWAPIWDNARNDNRLLNSMTKPTSLVYVDFSPLVFSILESISPPEALPGNVLKMRQDYSHLRELIKNFKDSALDAQSPEQLTNLMNSTVAEWAAALPQSSRSGHTEGYATGGIVLQPHSPIERA